MDPSKSAGTQSSHELGATQVKRPEGAVENVHPRGSKPAPPRIGGQERSHTVGQAAAPTNPPKGSEPRRRDQLLWLWPVGAVAVMAVAGHLLGAFGVLLSAIVVAATLVLLIGDEAVSLRSRIWITALAVVLAAGIVTGRYGGLDILAPQPVPAKPLDLRGKLVDADDIRGRSLRDAELAGAVLDGLDLRGHDLTGAKARGASFRRAVLDDVPLVRADLHGADFTDACLAKADLTGAQLGGVIASGADVGDVVVEQDRIKTAASWPIPGTPAPQHCR